MVFIQNDIRATNWQPLFKILYGIRDYSDRQPRLFPSG